MSCGAIRTFSSTLRLRVYESIPLSPGYYPCHPISRASARAFVATGCLDPSPRHQRGLVLDGHTRLALACELRLPRVPVLRLEGSAAVGWRKAVALLTNVHRRHLGEALRVALGTSLERIERARAKERQRAAGGARSSAQGGAGNGSPKRSAREREDDRAAARVAAQVGVSRKTYEPARAVLAKGPPALTRRLLAGRVSVVAAYAELRRAEAREAGEEASAPTEAGVYRGALDEVPGGRYRCLVIDPPWNMDDAGNRGASRHYATMSVDQIAALDVSRLSHPRGAHVWLWTTWAAIREGGPARVLAAWGFQWKSELVWVKHRMGLGHWLRSRTEVCVLGVRGKLPLLVRDQRGLLEARRAAHSKKPPAFYEVAERCSPGSRIELFGREVPHGWDAWGRESRLSAPLNRGAPSPRRARSPRA